MNGIHDKYYVKTIIVLVKRPPWANCPFRWAYCPIRLLFKFYILKKYSDLNEETLNDGYFNKVKHTLWEY